MKKVTELRARRRLTAVLGLAAVLIVAAVTVAVAAGSHVRRHPALAVVRTNPITVRGRGFGSHARVTVSLRIQRAPTGAGALVHRLRATQAGTFTTRFATGFDRCAVWSVSASVPGRAPVVARGPKPACAPM